MLRLILHDIPWKNETYKACRCLLYLDMLRETYRRIYYVPTPTARNRKLLPIIFFKCLAVSRSRARIAIILHEYLRYECLINPQARAGKFFDSRWR